MHVTGHVLAQYAKSNTADLLITGDEQKIIKALLDNEIGDCIGNIGNVVGVRLTLHEFSTLVNSSAEADILMVQLNRNVGKLDGKTATQKSETAQTTWPGMGANLEDCGWSDSGHFYSPPRVPR